MSILSDTERLKSAGWKKIAALADIALAEKAPLWRVGGKIPLNVYEGDAPMFQCHTPEDATRIVEQLNRARTALPEYAKLYMEALDLLSEIYFDSEGVDNKIRGKIQAMVATYHRREKPE